MTKKNSLETEHAPVETHTRHESLEFITFKISDRALSFYRKSLESAHAIGNHEAMGVWLKNLMIAKKERLLALEILKSQQGKVLKDDGGNDIKKSDLEKSVVEIDSLLDLYKEEAKKIKDEEPESTEPLVPMITQIAKYSALAEGEVDAETRSEITDFIFKQKRILEGLEKEEGQDTGAIHKNLRLLHDLYMKLNSPETINLQDVVETKVVIKTEPQAEPASAEAPLQETDGEVSEDIENYKHVSIQKDIRNLKNIFGRSPSDEKIRGDIANLIGKYKIKMQYRKNFLENEPAPYLGAPEYIALKRDLTSLLALEASLVTPIQSVKKIEGGVEEEQRPGAVETSKPDEVDLEVRKLIFDSNEGEKPKEIFTTYTQVVRSIIENKNPEARSIFLNEHKAMLRDMRAEIARITKDESPAAVNKFINRQEEYINTLINLLNKFGSYDRKENSALLARLRNDLRFLEKNRAAEDKSVVYNQITLNDSLSPEQIEILKTDPALYRNLTEAIDDYNNSVKRNDDKKTIEDYLEEIDLFTKMFEKYEKTYKPANSKKERIGKYKRISLGDPDDKFYVPPEYKSIMEQNRALIMRIANAVNEYNRLVDSQGDEKEISLALQKIKALQLTFRQYRKSLEPKTKEERKDERKKLAINKLGDDYHDYGERTAHAYRHGAADVDPKNKRSLSVDAHSDDYYEPFEKDKHLHKKERDASKIEPENKRITLDSETAQKPEESTEEITDIFYMRPDRDYSEIAADKGFDTWLKDITRSIEKDGIPLKNEIQDLEVWYAEYQEAAPYREKLDILAEEIRKVRGADPIVSLMTKEKISRLMYEIHRNGSRGIEKIEGILKSHQELKDRIAQNEINIKTDQIRKEINEQRSKVGKARELPSEQVQAILESRGEENIRENIYEMMNFLRDMENNYDFYSNGSEDIHHDILYMYSKYGSAKKSPLGKKISRLGRLGASIKSVFNRSPDVDEINNFARLIRKTRELNLVDRKTGNRDLAIANQGRMRDLMRLCDGQFSLLTEHVRNPNSNKVAELKGNEVEALKIFDEMYKTFSDAKYRSNKGKKEAEELLRAGDIPLETTEKMNASSLETLFDDRNELESFASQATYEVYTEALVNLEKEIDSFPKARKDEAKLTGLDVRYKEIRAVLEEVGNSEGDRLHLDKVALKIQNLAIRHIDRDKYKDLSDNFAVYDRMIANPDVPVTEKKGHVEDLIKALKKHREFKDNGIVQNKILDDTINTYEAKLKNIK